MTTATRMPLAHEGDDVSSPPPFEPPHWLRGPHAQTIIARYWPYPRARIASSYVEVEVEDGDRISILESCPPLWAAGDPAAILIHGLGGTARSPYVVRVAKKLFDRGVRVVRMNLRGAGAGFGAARRFYHSGKTEDLRSVVSWLAEHSPDSPIGLVGFSLGANLVLKLAGEAADDPLPGLDCLVAANPPLDLDACCRFINRPGNRVYDRAFLRLLCAEVSRLHDAFPELGPIDLSSASSLLDFDDHYTAPRNGFADASDYYARSSAGPLVPRITLPGLVIHAEDDPFIPADPFLQLAFPPHLALELIPHGGHLGYLSRNRWKGDRRWLDARILAWLAERWPLGRSTAHRDDSGQIHSTPEVGRS
ncbi:YheT family hydrolase [Tundrisphaera sp. TA3]|uniref:YheT family hydrolase n=1 Tax=Tundrisphaera sp. TA3 TaxID=3435775 RepID=UPI003EB97610